MSLHERAEQVTAGANTTRPLRSEDDQRQRPGPRCATRKPRATGAALRVALWAALLSLSACTNVIIPPPQPAEPRPVFVLDHGRHASLVLPRPDSGLVRYSYGDWRYYAQRKTGVTEASAAILWPTPAGLGRRELPGPATADAVGRAVRVWIEALYEVVVDRRAVDRLRERLDWMFRESLETRLYNAAYDLEFVHHPRPYTLSHNSNRVVAVWLKELGSQVRGALLFSKWKVEPAAER